MNQKGLEYKITKTYSKKAEILNHALMGNNLEQQDIDKPK